MVTIVLRGEKKNIEDNKAHIPSPHFWENYTVMHCYTFMHSFNLARIKAIRPLYGVKTCEICFT